jgi:hypothetical protein
MKEVNKKIEDDNTDKKLHISDVITRFNFPKGTEDKICRFLYLKGLIRTKTYDFYKFDEIFNEMCKLREEIVRL